MRLRHSALALALASGIAAIPAAHAVDSGPVITLGGTSTFFGDDRDIDITDSTVEDAMGGSLGLGYRFNEHWMTELVAAGTELEGTDLDVDFGRVQLDVLYLFAPDSVIHPYVVVGGGGGRFDADTDLLEDDDDALWNYGLGLMAELTNNLMLRGDVRGYYAADEDTTDVTGLLALSYIFGAEPAVDSDGDGVTDDMDQCPDTPAGVAVDKAGCPLDSDGDGVADYLDKCPDTPEGVEVNADGCPLDSDGDGVADYLDKCPKTPKGAKVDENGCQIILKEPVSIKLEVLFPTNSAAIAPTYYPEIKEVADFMVEYPSTEVTIEGHTDSTGAAEYNRVLSQRRANAVRQVLLERYSVDAKRVRAVGYGEERPVADNGTAAGRQANRRVVAVLKATKEKVLQKD